MLEQLLSFFAMMLWLEMQSPDTQYYWSWVEITWYLETGDISWQMNMQEIQKNIIIEDYFLLASRLGRIHYARGCAGEATPPTWNGQRRVKCWVKSFDCAGLMKYYWWFKQILDKKDVWYINSVKLYELWYPKDPRTSERWDFTSRIWFWESEWKTHFAIVSSWYSNGRLRVLDYTKWVPEERELRVSCNKSVCHYAWRYRISVATNWLVEEANRKWIQVNAFKILDNNDEVKE